MAGVWGPHSGGSEQQRRGKDTVWMIDRTVELVIPGNAKHLAAIDVT